MKQIISDEYREQNRVLHETNPHYGVSGSKWRGVVREISDWGRLPILDFGCGKQTLSKSLGPAYRVTDYDPCIPGLDTPPDPHPVLICGDVLEHIEPELLDNLLAETRRLCTRRGLFVVHLTPAKKHLPDGRNAHLIQKPKAWWSLKLIEHGFQIIKDGGEDQEAWFIVE